MGGTVFGNAQGIRARIPRARSSAPRALCNSSPLLYKCLLRRATHRTSWVGIYIMGVTGKGENKKQSGNRKYVTDNRKYTHLTTSFCS